LSIDMIGLVTYATYPELTDDDRPLIGELAAVGLEAVPVIWDDRDVRWSRFSALVMRSAWDYHLRPGPFVEWLGMVESRGLPLWNSVETVRWNMHKRYLRELASRGVLVPRTEWLARADPRPLSAIMRHNGWSDAIVKPAISASATDTWKTSGDPVADDRRHRELAERSDLLVQEVIPEVASDGEWSIIFIGGEYSHATIKRPRPGDFRVQTELGGSAAPATPPPGVIEAATAITGHIPGEWMFARIDAVVTARGLMLMEAECIEPLLFFEHEPASRGRFARALSQRVVVG
jgi:glutathione synthase/RimK-type ligase-like ATP-grasp enzyme